jgi:hypothetical protein
MSIIWTKSVQIRIPIFIRFLDIRKPPTSGPFMTLSIRANADLCPFVRRQVRTIEEGEAK